MTSTPDSKPGSARLAAGVVVAWSFMFGVVAAGLIGPNRNVVKVEYGLQYVHLGAALGGMFLVATLLAFRFGNRIRRRPGPSFAIALSVQAIGFAMIAATDSRVALAIGWLLGVVGLVVGSTTVSFLTNRWPGDASKGRGLLLSVSTLGKLVGPAAAAFAIRENWRLSFAAVAVISVVLLVATAAAHADFVKFKPKRRRTDHGLEMRLFRKPVYWLCVAPFGLLAGGEMAVVTQIPTYAETELGMAGHASALVLVAYVAGLIVWRLLTYRLVRAGRSGLAISICLASGLAIIPAAVLRDPVLVVVCIAISGGVFSSTWPAYYAQVSERFIGRMEILDYGAGMSSMVGIAVCLYASSHIGAWWPALGLGFGVVCAAIFGLIYFVSDLSKPGQPIDLERSRVEVWTYGPPGGA